MRIANRRASGIAIVVALSAMLGATPSSAAPASAATGVGVVEVSNDGVNFSRTYSAAVFDNIARLSPGDSQSETIYVRNSGTVAGYLRITMREVRYSDQHYGNALNLTTSTPAVAGTAKSISSANPCQVTYEGTIVAPGAIVPVVATLALGNLSGTDGQGATASLALRFALSDTTPGTLPATNCGGSGTSIPITPTSPGAAGGTATSGTLTGGIAVPAPAPSASAAPISGEASGAEVLPSLPSTFTLDPNTWRLYQEYLVLILVLAAVIGAGISWFAGRRSRKDTHDV
ncbi:hypothetical protein [Salinibacterium sp. TMP30]|uniref:hypothetical protein n=1 Tax=Salinibacterium sp. TMP30 TaxID=3138237 RepID=UPI0031386133